jgi:hypothetical protein
MYKVEYVFVRLVLVIGWLYLNLDHVTSVFSLSTISAPAAAYNI